MQFPSCKEVDLPAFLQSVLKVHGHHPSAMNRACQFLDFGVRSTAFVVESHIILGGKHGERRQCVTLIPRVVESGSHRRGEYVRLPVSDSLGR